MSDTNNTPPQHEEPSKGPRQRLNQRRTHKKSHLGCRNCKQRRIKCNEQLPVCGQCSKSKLTCSYLSLTQKEIEQRIKNQNIERIFLSTPSTPSSDTQQPPIIPVPTSGRYYYSSSSTTPYYDDTNLPPIYNSTNNENLPSINQSVVLPAMDRNPNLLATGKNPLFKQGFETDMIRTAYMSWIDEVMSWAFDSPPLYHSVMAFSFGYLAIRTGSAHHRHESDKHRFIALNELQSALANESILEVNTDALMACSIVLAWDIFFQDETATSYSILSKGFPAILERAQKVSPSPTLSSITDALFQGVRAIQFPPYHAAFFFELVDKVYSIEPYIKSSQNLRLIKEHYCLGQYVSSVLKFLKSNHRELISSWSGAKYYSPDEMFRFVKEWQKIFPVMALSSLLDDSRHDRYSIVLYTYYHAVTRALDAVFPEVRYIFQFGFIGPVDLVAIENSISGLKIDSEQSYLLSYPLKLLMFLKERLFLLNRLLIGSDNEAITPIKEVYVKSFEHTSLNPENYPSMDDHTSKNTANNGPSLSPQPSSTSIGAESDPQKAGDYHHHHGPNSNASINSDPITAPQIYSGNYNNSKQENNSIDMFKRYIQDRLEILQNLNE